LFGKDRIVTACAVVGFILLNVYTICSDFEKAVSGDGIRVRNRELLSLERLIFDNIVLTPAQVVSYAEITVLILFFARLIWLTFKAVRKQPRSSKLVVPMRSSRTLGEAPMINNEAFQYLQWKAVGELFMDLVPSLQVYSAMKLLRYAVPALVVRDTANLAAREQVLIDERRWAQAVWKVVVFIVKHGFLSVVGFEAFLLKFRKAYQTLSEGNDINAMLAVIAFLNQMLGVVNISTFAISRLHYFIFGGVDHVISEDEERRKDVWQASFHRLAWQACGGSIHNWRAVHYFALAFTFSDYDFQRLVLDDDKGDACAHRS
jgi:hypothetical protein